MMAEEVNYSDTEEQLVAFKLGREEYGLASCRFRKLSV
jgi:chemotaxis signal transduction protein